MTILKDFDFDEIRRKRQRASAQPTDLVAGLREISPEIEKLKVGETARLEIPGGQKNLRKFIMSITAKLNNLTPQGGAWAGRQYRTISDGEKYVYVQRGQDLKANDIPARKRGGRRPAGGDTSQSGSGAVVTEHAA